MKYLVVGSQTDDDCENISGLNLVVRYVIAIQYIRSLAGFHLAVVNQADRMFEFVDFYNLTVGLNS